MLFIDNLYLYNARAFQYRENEDGNNTDGRYIFNNNCEKGFSFEFSALLDFFYKGLGFDDIAHKNTGQQRHNGHYYTVADEIEEVQELKAHQGYFPP